MAMWQQPRWWSSALRLCQVGGRIQRQLLLQTAEQALLLLVAVQSRQQQASLHIMPMCRMQLSQQAALMQALQPRQRQTTLPVTPRVTMRWAWPMELLLPSCRRRQQTGTRNPRIVNYSGTHSHSQGAVHAIVHLFLQARGFILMGM